MREDNWWNTSIRQGAAPDDAQTGLTCPQGELGTPLLVVGFETILPTPSGALTRSSVPYQLWNGRRSLVRAPGEA
jgi:hypothetical protein